MERRGKKAQAQIITTVLLILIAIAAIAVLSMFIFNLVNQKLGGTDCFSTATQYEIKAGTEGATCYDATANQFTVTVQRGQNSDYNLTDLLIVAGDAASSESYSYEDDVNSGTLPGPGEKRTYTFNVVGGVDTISVTPVIGGGDACDQGTAESTIIDPCTTCTPDCTGKVTGDADGCGGTCA